MFVTYLIAWFGKSLLEMQIMQTSITTSTSLFSFLLASELSQLLALEKVPYTIFFLCTVISLGISCVVTFALPKDPLSTHFLQPSLASLFGSNEGFCKVLKETWQGRSLQILSLWWALAYGGFSLVQNYGTNLFDGISSSSTYNGHVIGASQAIGCLGSLSAMYIDQVVAEWSLLLYAVGSGIMGSLCLIMGVCNKLWVAYTLFIVISGIYQVLVCLISVQCGKLLSNGQYILLFSLNNFAGLLIATLLQAFIEILGLSIFKQFASFGIFFFCLTVMFATLCCLAYCKTRELGLLASSKGAIYGKYDSVNSQVIE